MFTLAVYDNGMELDPRNHDRMLAEGQALADRIAALEAQLDEQQQVLRHTLTMLIEWIEGQGEA